MNLDPQWVADKIAKIDIGNLIIIILAFWFFYSRLTKKISESVSEINKKFDGVDKKFDAIDKRFDAIDQRFIRIEGEIKEMRTSLNRLEGAFMNKDCCMIKDEKQVKKAG